MGKDLSEMRTIATQKDLTNTQFISKVFAI